MPIQLRAECDPVSIGLAVERRIERRVRRQREEKKEGGDAQQESDAARSDAGSWWAAKIFERNVMWLRRRLGDSSTLRHRYQGQSLIIMTRSDGSGNVEKERSGKLDTPSQRPRIQWFASSGGNKSPTKETSRHPISPPSETSHCIVGEMVSITTFSSWQSSTGRLFTRGPNVP